MAEVVAAVREAANQGAVLPAVTTVLGEIDAAIARILGERTVKDLIAPDR